MKKFVFGLIATGLLVINTSAQTSKEEWSKMIEYYKTSINNILSKECPKDMNLNNFKISLINGKSSLSENAQIEIEKASKEVKDYGLEFAKKNALEAVSDSDLIFYSSFSPDLPISDGLFNAAESKLTWADVGNCALSALGADALYSLAFSGASSWSIAGLTSTFAGVAKRFLGPVGVAIAVISFSLCLANI